jgi:hypothetical protein
MRSRFFRLLFQCFRTLRYRVPLKYYIWVGVTIALISIFRSCFGFTLVTVWQPSAKLLSTPERGYRFGKEIAADGNTLVASISTEDAKQQALAYVYEREGTQWRESAVLTSPELQGHRFANNGIEVDISGNTIAVSIPKLEETTPSAISSYSIIHIFERDGGNWIQTNRIITKPEADIYAMSLDRDTLAIIGGGAGIGVYTRNPTTGDWSDQVMISTGSFNRIDVSGDTIIASRNDNKFDNGIKPDGAQIYTRDPLSKKWALQTVLHPEREEDEQWFGASVSVDQDTIVVGVAPEATAQTWGEDILGCVYVYRRDLATGDWKYETRLVPDGALVYWIADYGFGASTTVKDNQLLVGNGNTDEEAVYYFTYEPEQKYWRQRAKVFTYNGPLHDPRGVAIGEDFIAVSDLDLPQGKVKYVGGVYLFDLMNP